MGIQVCSHILPSKSRAIIKTLTLRYTTFQGKQFDRLDQFGRLNR